MFNMYFLTSASKKMSTTGIGITNFKFQRYFPLYSFLLRPDGQVFKYLKAKKVRGIILNIHLSKMLCCTEELKFSYIKKGSKIHNFILYFLLFAGFLKKKALLLLRKMSCINEINIYMKKNACLLFSGASFQIETYIFKKM